MKFFNRSIRNKVVVLLLIFGILPAAVVFGIIMSQTSAVEEKLQARVLETAIAMNDVIDRNLFERYGDVQAFGLNSAAREPSNWGNPRTDNELVSAMNGYMTGYGIYKLMMLVGTDGSVLAVNTVGPKGNEIDTGGLYGRSFAEANWFKKAIAGNFLEGSNGLTGTVVEQAHVESVVAEFDGSDGYVLTFAAPVRDQVGSVIGVWVNFADFGLVEEIVASFFERLAQDGMSSAELTILDPEGRIIVDYDPAGQGFSGIAEYRRNPEIIGKFNLVEKGVKAAVEAVKGNTGAIVANHARKKIDQASGYLHSAGAYDYPGLGWSALARIPTDEAFALWKNLMLVLEIALIAGILAIIAIGLFVGTKASSPMVAMTNAMKRLADGDLLAEVPLRDRGDELGSMAQAVDVFKQNAIERERMEGEQTKAREAEEARLRAEAERAASVSKMIEDFDSAAKQMLSGVTAAAEQLKSSANAMSSSADESSQRTTAVAGASEEASVNVQTVASATEEMTASVQEIARRVTHSSEIASTAVREAEGANAKVESLAAAAQKIGEVVSLINDIADQTNLLALNATIEAARAGDAGKGFAVVASEVKSLASQTGQATEEIGGQITAIQAATTDAVAAIQSIAKTIGEISEVATTVASAVEEQEAATREIAENIQQAASGTQQVSTNITEVSRGVQETGTAASQVLEASNQLSKQAADLQTSISSFLDNVKAA